jgi:hypothetical protein
MSNFARILPPPSGGNMMMLLLTAFVIAMDHIRRR